MSAMRGFTQEDQPGIADHLEQIIVLIAGADQRSTGIG
jgi:hypothetical protein